MQRNNPHLIGICSIAVASVVAFWGFGLAEKIMPQEKISQILDVPSNDQPMPLKNSVFSSASASVESKDEPMRAPEKKAVKIENTAKQVSNLELLEKKEFQLNLSGIYYAGSPSASKPAYLAMRLHPVLGSSLESFEVVEAKMTFDNSRISVKISSVSIKGGDVLMTFASDAVGSFVIKGTLDESILSDKNNKQTLVIQNQLFYLAQKGVPYHIDMTGTLSAD
ncbi:MAG: hypothetical protein EPO62_01965 [Candidatus Nitrosotenuis sp.]|nr:MAG: hypothetical protein EPO62_01965 [Candidatus Nitrosotenuis sp.]